MSQKGNLLHNELMAATYALNNSKSQLQRLTRQCCIKMDSLTWVMSGMYGLLQVSTTGDTSFGETCYVHLHDVTKRYNFPPELPIKLQRIISRKSKSPYPLKELK